MSGTLEIDEHKMHTKLVDSPFSEVVFMEKHMPKARVRFPKGAVQTAEPQTC